MLKNNYLSVEVFLADNRIAIALDNQNAVLFNAT